MKKSLLIIAFAMMSIFAMADVVPGMVVSKADGSSFNVIISQLRSIKFSGDNMIINKMDNTQMSVAIDDIKEITFPNVTTAVQAIAGTSESKQMVITDLSGRVIYKGDSLGSNIPSSLHGIYIITVDGQSHKISLR